MGEINKYVVCRVGHEEFGLPIEQVISIEKPLEITEVPQMPDYILGVSTIRGKVTPILDLRIHLLNKDMGMDEYNRMILVQVDGIFSGLLVDEANEVLDIADDSVENIEMNNEKENEAMKVANLDDRLILLLDLHYMLTLNADLFEQLIEAQNIS